MAGVRRRHGVFVGRSESVDQLRGRYVCVGALSAVRSCVGAWRPGSAVRMRDFERARDGATYEIYVGCCCLVVARAVLCMWRCTNQRSHVERKALPQRLWSVRSTAV